MMRILAVCGAPFTYGELGLLFSFADELPAGQAEMVYLTGVNHHPLLRRGRRRGLFLEPGERQGNERKVARFLARYQPDLILVPDFLSLWYTGFLYGLSLAFWRSLEVPVVSFDSHGWCEAGYRMDIAGQSVDLIEAAVDWFAETIPVCPFQLPSAADGNRLALPLFKNGPVSVAEKTHWRSAAGCNHDQKLVFLVGLFDHRQSVCRETLPLWARAFGDGERMVQAGRGIAAMAARVQASLAELLRLLGDGIRIVTVAHMTADAAAQWQDLPVASLPPLDEARYDALLGSADLVLSLNGISGSLVKAARAGVPALALGQGLPAAKLRAFFPAAGDEELYRWRYFPVGMHDYYTPLLAADPLGGSCLYGEIFETRQSAETLRGLLYDSLVRGRLGERQAALSRQMDQLSSPRVVLDILQSRWGREAVAWS